MADDNSTVLDSEEQDFLDEFNSSDPDSQEQRVDEADEDDNDSLEDPKGQLSNKFQTKTSQKLSLVSELATFLLDDNKIKELQQRKPELAERLKRDNKFSHLFSESSPGKQVEDTEIKDRIAEALRNVEVNGTKLPASDIDDAMRNPEFMKRASALMKGGADRFEAVEYSLSKAYGVKNKRIPSVLNASSEEIPYSKALPKLTADEKQFAQIYGVSEEEIAKAKAQE